MQAVRERVEKLKLKLKPGELAAASVHLLERDELHQQM